MAVSLQNIFYQKDVIQSLGTIAFNGLLHRDKKSFPEVHTQGAYKTRTIQPLNERLVAEYISHVGGKKGNYKNTIPFHFFPHWLVPVLSDTMAEIPFSMLKIINGGCSVKINQPLHFGEKLLVKARLENIDVGDTRVIIKQKAITETNTKPNALVVEQTTIIPLAKNGNKKSTKKKDSDDKTIPVAVTEIGSFYAVANAGWEFALLTGDVNPLHWLQPYANASGFKRPILHGYSSFARTMEQLNRNLFSGDTSTLQAVEVKFVAPFYLPGEARVFIDNTGQFYAGNVPGGIAYLKGSYTTK
ncbi:MAG: MaoC/PaaZ C-terminal domain-containing protein [Spirochaetota bacterium]